MGRTQSGWDGYGNRHEVGEHSADRRMIWDGERWVSAISPGETHWWNGHEWAELPYKAMTKTYTGKHGQAPRGFQEEANRLAPYGWRPQVSTVMEGGRQLGSAAIGVALAGPVGGLIGATRRHPDQITISYVRD